MEILAFLEKYFLLFIIYSVSGWIIEEIYCSILEKKIVNRGFLIGPLCPIYGFGGVAITLFLMRFQEYPIAVFVLAVVVSAILEYFTSYIMEKIFNARWWDYSGRKFNLNGRICARTLIPFGLFGLAVVYVLTPFLFGCIEKIPQTTMHILTLIIAVVLLIDVIVSMKVVSKVTHVIKGFKSPKTKDDTNDISSEISKLVKEELEKTKLGRRILAAFPDLTKVKEKIKRIKDGYRRAKN